jgi:hypothetical protein
LATVRLVGGQFNDTTQLRAFGRPSDDFNDLGSGSDAVAGQPPDDIAGDLVVQSAKAIGYGQLLSPGAPDQINGFFVAGITPIPEQAHFFTRLEPGQGILAFAAIGIAVLASHGRGVEGLNPILLSGFTDDFFQVDDLFLRSSGRDEYLLEGVQEAHGAFPYLPV